MLLAGNTIGAGHATTDHTSTLPSIDIRVLVPEDIRYAPGAATKLTADEITELRPYTLHDALDAVPGVRTIDDDALGLRSGIGIRGAPPRRSRKTLLLEDGTPINASTYLDSDGHYTPPLQRLEQVEVLKGTGQILHGPLNNHGIVNFRNKRATLTPETTVEIAGGMLDTFNRHVMHRRRFGLVGMVLSYTGQNADGVFDIEKHQWDDFYGNMNWDINDRHHLDLSFTYFRERSDGFDESNLTPQEFFTSSGSARSKQGRFGQEFNSIAVDYFKGDIAHNFQITDNWSSTSRFFASRLERPRFTVDPGEIAFDALPGIIFAAGEDGPFIPGKNGQMVSRDRTYQTYGLENRMELADIRAFGLNHTLQWGVRAERHLMDDQRRTGAVGEVLSVKNKGPKPLSRDTSLQALAFSLFAQNAMQFADWTVTAGLRAEWFRQSRSRKDSPPKLADENTVLLPGISILYVGLRDTQVFGSVMRGYSPAIARSVDFPLVPETGINSQIGLRSSIITGFSFEIAGFYNMLKNTLVSEGVRDFSNIVINSGDSRAIGVDLGLRFDSAAYIDSPYNFFSKIVYNYTRAEFTKGVLNGHRIPQIPLHNGSLTFGIEHTDGWSVSGTISHFGSFFSDIANTQPITLTDENLIPIGHGDVVNVRELQTVGKVPSHTLFSARAGYTLSGKLFGQPGKVTFWVQGRNLANKLYISQLENGVRPGAERSVIGGVTVKF